MARVYDLDSGFLFYCSKGDSDCKNFGREEKMVAERELCRVVEVSYSSVQISSCKPSDDPSSEQSQLDLKAASLSTKNSMENGKEQQFIPILRSGSYSDVGRRRKMEDEHVCIDDMSRYLGAKSEAPKPRAFYGVFDGHGGPEAAVFVRDHLLRNIVDDIEFEKVHKKDSDCHLAAEKAVRNGFLSTDLALAEENNVDSYCGTTALTALILGRSLLVANAGDCRAVLSKRGKAVEMSRDHKPECTIERLRIEALGGLVYDGYLNGELSVARALGDWSMKLPKGSSSPLTAEPEFRQAVLTEEDEFLIIGCDGIWDVISSQNAVEIVRKALIRHNDPVESCKELVEEALSQSSCDNLTAVVVCFSAEPPARIERSRMRLRVTTESLCTLRCLIEDV